MNKGTKVLVVDDDVHFAEGLSDVLRSKGAHCVLAHDGDEALAKAKSVNFDIILADIKMPAKNGVEMCREIKKIIPHQTVIMMTAFREENLIQEALKEGTYGVIQKPLDINRVLKLIETSQEGGAFVEIVDDDPNTRETLKDNLEIRGYIVTSAATAEDAIKVVKERPQDIIFLDMKLPTLSGLDVFLKVQEINKAAKVVVMTAYGKETKGMIEEAVKKGAYAVLHKPFSIDDVLRIIGEVAAEKKRNSGRNGRKN